jgi:hypothetical protein
MTHKIVIIWRRDPAARAVAGTRSDVCLGSFATEPAGPAYHLMSASLRKRPNSRGTAICRDGPLPDSCAAAMKRLFDHLVRELL